jgi:C-terminal processing protease CtpA/Prc
MAIDLKPRLCHVRKWDDFQGYGFNLHAEKGRVGQFIGKVDDDSPASAAGLKEGDRIVEVNGTNISNENHAQVVSRIKAVADETKLLVVDSETDKHYKEQKLVIRGDLPEVVTIVCPRKKGGDDNAENDQIEAVSSSNADDEDHPYHPRLCHLKIWPTFSGYGFNLHAEKNKPGQYIGKVDDGSPAQAAGLREGDKIVEVNGENISTSNHQAVVQQIKKNPNEAKLLVMDAETLAYFERKNITVNSSSACVHSITCPDQAAESNGVSSSPSPPSTTHPYNARLCHVRTWVNWPGFGFNMQSQKGKPGQFIGSVDAGSPAELAGLKEGDRILAVNGTSVKGFEHPQVVQLIKTDPTSTKLLLVDREADDYFISKGIDVKAEDDFVVHKANPETQPLANGSSVEVKAEEPPQVNGDASADQSAPEYAEINETEAKKEESKEDEPKVVEEAAPAVAAAAAAASAAQIQAEINETEKKEEEVLPSSAQGPLYAEIREVEDLKEEPKVEETPTSQLKEAEEAADAIAAVAAEAEEQLNKEEEKKKKEEAPASSVSSAASSSTPAPAASAAPKSPVVIEGIEFAASAKEARERMSRKKNVKDNALSMKERYEMFQRL